jgi:hypothetical protein
MVVPVVTPAITDFVMVEPQSGDALAAPMTDNMVSVDMAEEALIAPNDSTKPREAIITVPTLSIRELLKKYQPLGAFTFDYVPTALGTGIKCLDIMDLMIPPQVTATPITLPPTDSGLFSHYMPLYRQFKGPLRFKMLFNIVDSASTPSVAVAGNYQNVYSVYYCPPMLRVGDAINLNTLKSIINQNSSFGDVNSALISNYRPLIRLPVHLCTYPQRILEFEVPYSTIFSSVLTRTVKSNDVTLQGSLGYLIVCSTMRGSGVYEEVRPYIAFGDESRYGTLFNVPPVITANNLTGNVFTSFPPDRYGVSTVVYNTLPRL